MQPSVILPSTWDNFFCMVMPHLSSNMGQLHVLLSFSGTPCMVSGGNTINFDNNDN
jgi:hypothetical protein